MSAVGKFKPVTKLILLDLARRDEFGDQVTLEFRPDGADVVASSFSAGSLLRFMADAYPHIGTIGKITIEEVIDEPYEERPNTVILYPRRD